MGNTIVSGESGDFVMGYVNTSCKIAEVFSPQNGGELSDSIVQNWTLQAIECYELKQNCEQCSISKGNYSFVCQMPKVVDSLLNEYGSPGKNLVRIF